MTGTLGTPFLALQADNENMMTRRSVFSAIAAGSAVASAPTIDIPPIGTRASFISERRWKLVQVSAEFIMEWFEYFQTKPADRKSEVTFEGIPKGATLRRVSYDVLTDSFYFALEHPSFARLNPGDQIPMADVTVHMRWLNSGLITSLRDQ